MKKILLSLFLVCLAGTAQASPLEYDPTSIRYEGTPLYPDNYGTETDIFDSLKLYVIDDPLTDQPKYRYLESVINSSVVGATFFYKGRQVGQVQNIENAPFPGMLFTDVDFFLSKPALGVFQVLGSDDAPCPEGTCYHYEPRIEQLYTFIDGVYLHYWDYTANPVPEPSTYALLLSGLGLLGWLGRRRANRGGHTPNRYS